MRPAFSVSATFFRNYLLNQGRFYIHAYLLTYLLVAAKIAPTDLLKLFWCAFPFFFVLGFVPTTFGRNMGWITALPISRTALAFSAIGSAFTMLILALLLAWPSAYVLGGPALFWKAFDQVGALFRIAGEVLRKLDWSNGGLNALLYGVLMILLVGLVAFPRDMRKIAERKLGKRAQRPTLKSVAPSLVGVAIFLLLVGKFASLYLFFMIAFGGALFGVFYSLDQTYGLPPMRRRFYFRGTIVLLVAVVLGSYVALRAQLNSEDRGLAFSAQGILPSGMSGMSEERLARFAASAKDVEDLKKVLRAWREEWYPESRLPYASVKDLFARPEFLPTLFANVRNREIPNETFMAYLERKPDEEESMKTNRSQASVLNEAYSREFSESEIGKLLVSENAELRAFARNWLGYRFDPANAERIVAPLRKPSPGLDGMNLDRERATALEIVAAMAGKEIRFEDLFGPRSVSVVRGLVIPPANVDCESCFAKDKKAECSGMSQAYCARMAGAKSHGVPVR